MSLKVLFCGHDMQKGYEYTVEAAADHGVEVTRCPAGDVAAAVCTASILVPLMTKMNRTVLQLATRAELILQYGVGLEGVDMAAATELGIYVSNIPSKMTGNALSCAEHVLYLMLGLLRDQKAMDQSVRSMVLGSPCGDTLHGKYALIVGYGGIAQELIPRLHALGVRMACVRSNTAHWQQPDGLGSHKPQLVNSAADAEEIVALVQQEGAHRTRDRMLQEDQGSVFWGPATQDPASLLSARGGQDELLQFAADADFIVLTCPQTEVTAGMVNSKLLARCKKGVRIINVARGGLLEYNAVLAGLNSGQIGGLGLDVQWQEPFDPQDAIARHPKVLLTPHIAGVTEPSYRAMAQVVAQEARRLQQGLGPSRPLNAPSQPRTVLWRKSK